MGHPYLHTFHIPGGTWSKTGSVGQESVWVFALNPPREDSEAERVRDRGEALKFTTPALGIGTNHKDVYPHHFEKALSWVKTEGAYVCPDSPAVQAPYKLKKPLKNEAARSGWHPTQALSPPSPRQAALPTGLGSSSEATPLCQTPSPSQVNLGMRARVKMTYLLPLGQSHLHFIFSGSCRGSSESKY